MRGHTHARSLPHPPARSFARGRTRGRPQPGQRRGAAGSGGGRTAGRGGGSARWRPGGLRGRGGVAGRGGPGREPLCGAGNGRKAGVLLPTLPPTPPAPSQGYFPQSPRARGGWVRMASGREGEEERGRERGVALSVKSPPPSFPRGAGVSARLGCGGVRGVSPSPPSAFAPPAPSGAAPRVRPRRPLPWPRAGGSARCRQRGVRARLPLPLLSLLPLI